MKLIIQFLPFLFLVAPLGFAQQEGDSPTFTKTLIVEREQRVFTKEQKEQTIFTLTKELDDAFAFAQQKCGPIKTMPVFHDQAGFPVDFVQERLFQKYSEAFLWGNYGKAIALHSRIMQGFRSSTTNTIRCIDFALAHFYNRLLTTPELKDDIRAGIRGTIAPAISIVELLQYTQVSSVKMIIERYGNFFIAATSPHWPEEIGLMGYNYQINSLDRFGTKQFYGGQGGSEPVIPTGFKNAMEGMITFLIDKARQGSNTCSVSELVKYGFICSDDLTLLPEDSDESLDTVDGVESGGGAGGFSGIPPLSRTGTCTPGDLAGLVPEVAQPTRLTGERAVSCINEYRRQEAIASYFLSPGCPVVSAEGDGEGGNQLADQTPGCESDAGCPSGQTCSGGRCVVTTAGCQNDSECPSGQACSGGQCAVQVTGSACNQVQCPKGQECQNGQCATPQQTQPEPEEEDEERETPTLGITPRSPSQPPPPGPNEVIGRGCQGSECRELEQAINEGADRWRGNSRRINCLANQPEWSRGQGLGIPFAISGVRQAIVEDAVASALGLNYQLSVVSDEVVGRWNMCGFTLSGVRPTVTMGIALSPLCLSKGQTPLNIASHEIGHVILNLLGMPVSGESPHEVMRNCDIEPWQEPGPGDNDMPAPDGGGDPWGGDDCSGMDDRVRTLYECMFGSEMEVPGDPLGPITYPNPLDTPVGALPCLGEGLSLTVEPAPVDCHFIDAPCNDAAEPFSGTFPEPQCGETATPTDPEQCEESCEEGEEWICDLTACGGNPCCCAASGDSGGGGPGPDND